MSFASMHQHSQQLPLDVYYKIHTHFNRIPVTKSVGRQPVPVCLRGLFQHPSDSRTRSRVRTYGHWEKTFFMTHIIHMCCLSQHAYVLYVGVHMYLHTYSNLPFHCCLSRMKKEFKSWKECLGLREVKVHGTEAALCNLLYCQGLVFWSSNVSASESVSALIRCS